MHCALSLSFFLTSDDIILDAGFVIIRLTETRTLYPVRVCTLPLSPISNVHFTTLCAYKWKITNSGSIVILYYNSAIYCSSLAIPAMPSFALPSLFFLDKIRDRKKKSNYFVYIVDC